MATLNSHDMTKTIGNCGRFQVALSLAVNGAYSSASWGIIFMAFGIYNPGFSCLDNNGSNASSMLNITMFYAVDSTSHTEIVSNATKWSVDCNVKEKCDNLMYNPESSTIVTEWDLSCDLAWITSVIISIQMSGVLVGAYIAGLIGDRFGRKVAICLSSVFQTLGHLAASFSVSWQMYASFMFCLGMGSGGLLAICFHYPMEFLTSWWRGILASVPFWNFGCTIFSFGVFILKDWRNIHIAGCVVSALALLPLLMIPESVRWLTISGNVTKAKKVVTKIARMNGRPFPDTKIIDEIAQEEKTTMGDYRYTYLDLFRLKSIRGYSIKFGIIWIVMVIAYYAISFGIKSLSGNFYLNLFIFSIFDTPAVFSVAPSVTKFGRKIASLLYFSLTATSALCVVVVFHVASGNVKDISILILALICKAVVVSEWYIVKVFSSELHPTVVRSLHYGYVNSVSRVGSIVAPYIISNDPNTLYVPFLIIGILALFSCGIIWTLPETRRMHLQDRAMEKSMKAKPITEANEEFD